MTHEAEGIDFERGDGLLAVKPPNLEGLQDVSEFLAIVADIDAADADVRLDAGILVLLLASIGVRPMVDPLVRRRDKIDPR